MSDQKCLFCVGAHFKFWRDFGSASGSLYQFPVEALSFTGWWLVVGQLRPTCPHIRRALPTKAHLFIFRCVSNFVWVWLKLRTQGFQDHRASPESSLRTYIGRLSTPVVCSYAVHFRTHTRTNVANKDANYKVLTIMIRISVQMLCVGGSALQNFSPLKGFLTNILEHKIFPIFVQRLIFADDFAITENISCCKSGCTSKGGIRFT